MPELVMHAKLNNKRWKELDEAGVTTIADVKRAQRQAAAAAAAAAATTTESTAEE